jgi:hypothetical protein
MSKSRRVRLGVAAVTSGRFILVDPAYLPDWIGKGGQVDDAACTDVEVTGPDAVRLGTLLDRQWDPRFFYDVPNASVPDLLADLERLRVEAKLSATVTAAAGPMSYRDRVEHALAHGGGVGEVTFDGASAMVGRCDPHQGVVVDAEPVSDDVDARLRTVALTFAVVGADAPRDEDRIVVGVDSGCLLLADLDQISGWTDADFAGASERLRKSSSNAVSVTYAGGEALMFATTWGDGAFQLHVRFAPAEKSVTVQVELGTPAREKLLGQVEYLATKFALVSRKITDDGEPVRFMYRERPDNESDGGWRAFSGTEDDAYNDNPENVSVVRLEKLAELDTQVASLLCEPEGSVFERRPEDEGFKVVTDWSPPS